MLAALSLACAHSDWVHTHLWGLRPTMGGTWAFAFLLLAIASGALGLWLRRHLANEIDVGTPTMIARIVTGSGRMLGSWRSAALVTAIWLPLMQALLWSWRQQLFLAPPLGLGDSLLILDQVPVYAHLLGYLDSFDELLALYLRCKTYLITAWPIQDAYALVSVSGYVIYGGAIAWLLWDRPPFEFWLGAALLLATPGVQLFAGYVEHYSLVTAWLALTVVLGLRLLEAHRTSQNEHSANPSEFLRLPLGGVAALGGAAAVATLHHTVAVITLPALAYCVWQIAFRTDSARDESEKNEAGPRSAGWRRFLLLIAAAASTALPILALVWGWFLFFEDPPLAIFDSHAASPPFYRPTELVNPVVLRNRLNLLFLAVPAGLLLLAIGWLVHGVLCRNSNTPTPKPSGGRFSAGLRWLAPEPTHRFVITYCGGIFALLFVMEPHLGFPADWDLHAIYQFPLNLFCFARIASAASLENLRARRAWTLWLPLIFAAQLLPTAGWIARNAEHTGESAQNLRITEANVASALEAFARDAVYRQVPVDRRKTYIQVQLFFGRSKLRLKDGAGDFSTGERERLLNELNREQARFQEWVLLPPDRFAAQYDEIWQAMTKLNVRINAAP